MSANHHSTDTERPVRPAGRIERTGDGYVLAFDQQLDYPRSYIWSLLTEPGRVAAWFGVLTPGWEQGKEFTLDMGGGIHTGTVLQLKWPTSLQISWEDPLGHESVLEWRVLESNGGTLLQFRAFSETADFLTEGAAGWQTALAALERAAAGQNPDWTNADWIRLRDAYSQEFSVSHSMGLVQSVSGHPAVRFDRLLNVPPQDVWDALTEPRRLARWLAPTELQLQAGGSIAVGLEPHPARGDVGYVEAPRALEYSWSSADAPESTVHWGLEPAGDPSGSKTMLRFTQVLQADARQPVLLAGWHQHLDALAAVLAGLEWHWSDGRFEALRKFYTRLEQSPEA
jgi:uncharacterized protein YndB with AHSA1/START domain